MPLRRGPRLTYANVVSTVCLFLLLGGTAYAAATIGSKQIKDGSIQGKDIKDGTIKSADVTNGSVAKSDFKSGKLPTGPRGAQGATGATGPTGAPGTPGGAGKPAAGFVTGGSTFCSACSIAYAAPMGNAARTSAATDAATLSPPRAIVASDLRLSDTDASKVMGFTLLVNGSATTLRCDTTLETRMCVNTTARVAIPAQSTIAFRMEHSETSGSSTAKNILFSWRASLP